MNSANSSHVRSVHLLPLIVLLRSTPSVFAASKTEAGWKQRARNISIVRDNWGIAHVTGKTDADAVFGMIYAQAEDDFNRVETNYLNAMGRLAEAEGETAIWRDLRMKIFVQPDDLKNKIRDESCVAAKIDDGMGGRSELLSRQTPGG